MYLFSSSAEKQSRVLKRERERSERGEGEERKRQEREKGEMRGVFRYSGFTVPDGYNGQVWANEKLGTRYTQVSDVGTTALSTAYLGILALTWH